MRAAVIRDKTLSVVEVEDPRAGSDDVIVDVAAAGLNAADVMQVRGGYPAPPGWPADIPGLELAGRIREVGPGVRGWQVGDPVMALVGGGAHAERARVPATALIRIPDGIEFDMAAGFPEGFMTAWDALLGQAGLIAGDRVLVTGAAGGVGLAAVQIAATAGARVFASVRRESAAAQIRSVVPDATVVIAGREGDSGPFDIVLELVGGPDAESRVGQLAIGGRIVVIGVGAGARMNLSLHQLMSVRGRILASTLRARTDFDKAVLTREVESKLVGSFGAGRLTVPIDSTYPLDEVDRAYERMAASGKFGKVVLRVDPAPRQGRRN